jgi:hypothetical protein
MNTKTDKKANNKPNNKDYCNSKTLYKKEFQAYRKNDRIQQVEKLIDANLPEDYDRQGVGKT